MFTFIQTFSMLLLKVEHMEVSHDPFNLHHVGAQESNIELFLRVKRAFIIDTI